MLHPLWITLSLVALAGGILVILAPRFVTNLNRNMGKALVDTDDLFMRHRHILGILLLIVSYLCFRLAILIAAG